MTETPDHIHDPWTPDQESQLLKALVQYKPIGIHAHFRMLSIRNSLLSSGTTSPETTHTQIPGIWTKIRTLYDVDGLDEREDGIFTSLRDGAGGDGAVVTEGDGNGVGQGKSRIKGEGRGNEDRTNDDIDNEEEEEEVKVPRGRGRPKGQGKNKNALQTSTTAATTTAENAKNPKKAKPGYWRDFELPRGDADGEFEALMWDRRLNPEGTPDGSDWETNQPRMPTGNDNAVAGETTDEPRSSPAPTASTTRRGTRSGRKGRVDKLKDEMEIDTPTSGRSSRRASKAASEVDEEMEDVDNEDEGDDDDEESEEPEEEEEEKRGTTSKRGRGGRRGRGKRGRRRG